MTDLQQKIDRIIAEVLEPRLAEARAEIAARLAEHFRQEAPAGAPLENASALLNSATAAVQGATSQAEILGAMLEGASNFAARSALFVLRGASAVGWQGRGFGDNSVIKQLTVDRSVGLAARAIQDRMAASAAATEFSPELVRACGNPGDGNCLLVPLVVREKVPALLYADAGRGGRLDSSALELLVRSAGIWLELIAARRSATASEAHAPEKAAAAAVEAAPAPAVSAPAPPPVPDEDEIHRKARRFAKLLVDEIRLYNQAKVAEGRTKKDLYTRLKDDIDKSRATYDKRYGSTPAASADYFTQELVRILAENDATLLGSNFPRP